MQAVKLFVVDDLHMIGGTIGVNFRLVADLSVIPECLTDMEAFAFSRFWK